jgi:DNA-binding HxlR family transcriptional regulator
MAQTERYGQYCPAAMALEILGGRWTLLVMRELLSGSTRFNELRRGLPRMSPALLSKRLKELETHGLVRREPSADADVSEYILTPSGKDAWDVVYAMGIWGQRWVETKVTLRNLDPSLLMWDMRRNLKPSLMPKRRVVVQFLYRDLNPLKQNYWLVVDNEQVDVCYVDPGFDVDVYVETDLGTMTRIWMGMITVRSAMSGGSMALTGDRDLTGKTQDWLGLSVFAREEKRVA